VNATIADEEFRARTFRKAAKRVDLTSKQMEKKP